MASVCGCGLAVSCTGNPRSLWTHLPPQAPARHLRICAIAQVDWTTQPFMTARDPKYRVRVLVPCYKEDVDVLRKTLTRAARALHEGAACIAEVKLLVYRPTLSNGV